MCEMVKFGLLLKGFMDCIFDENGGRNLMVGRKLKGERIGGQMWIL
jgi:hypothetical protein